MMRSPSQLPFDLDGLTFRSVSNIGSGEVDGATLFYYRQHGAIVSAAYSGGRIVSGHLLARMSPAGELDMRYHHVNTDGELMLGTCRSTPERLPDGRLRFHEAWTWLSGDGSSGRSTIEQARTSPQEAR